MGVLQGLEISDWESGPNVTTKILIYQHLDTS